MLNSTPRSIPINKIRGSNLVRGIKNYSTKENTIEELKESIRANGLICPIAVMPIPDTDEYIVVAGDRRRTCLQQLWEEGDMRFVEVQCMVYAYTDSEEQLLSIALFENVHRAQLTWQEKATGIKQLHALKTKTIGKALPSTKNTGWRQSDTAEFFGISQQTVSRALVEASAIEKDPQIAACKERKDAINIMMKKAEQDIIAEQARRRKAAVEASTAGDLDKARKALSEAYVVGDAVAFLESIPAGSIGLLNLDWPWNINTVINKCGSGSMRAANAENEALGIMPDADYAIFMHKVLTACYNALALDSWLLVWFGSNQHEATLAALKQVGFDVERFPAIWTKDTSTLSKLPDRRLNSGYETFFYAWKGCPYIAQRNRSNVFHYAQAAGRVKNHPAEKPVALMQDIISTFAFPHALVCDPFAGSGNTLLAAANLNMRCCGCDMHKPHYDRYVMRVFDGRPGEYA